MQNSYKKYKSNLLQRCFVLSLDVINLADLLPKKRSAWVIIDQLLRSTCSIGANLTEAKASSSRLEYKKFYEIALKSANETTYWMKLLRDSKLSSADVINPLLEEVTEICKMVGTGVLKLKAKTT